MRGLDSPASTGSWLLHTRTRAYDNSRVFKYRARYKQSVPFTWDFIEYNEDALDFEIPLPPRRE